MARNRKYAVVAVLMGVVLSLATVVAQEKAAQPSSEMPYPMPKPGAEMKKLDFLLGQWQTVEAHESMPGFAGGKGQGKTSTQLGPGGLSIFTDYQSTGVVGVFQGRGIITWEATEKAYRTFWFDNMQAGSMTMAGQWEGNDLVFMGDLNMMGQMVKFKQVYTEITPRSYTIKMYVIEGSETKLVMTMKSAKK